jgi:peptidoglycan/xylan/chitin deacetylase (PgdA/CDA1 family)
MSWFVWLIIFLTTPWLFFYILWKIKFKSDSKITVPVLAYHQINDDFDFSITRQKVCQFERGVRYLHDQGYKAVSLDEVLDTGADHHDKKVAFTFDDAYQDMYSNAFPILKEFNFTACIFVITGYVGKQSDWDYRWGRNRRRHLTWEQIKEMSQAGFTFGSHTVNHPDLTGIQKRQLEYELKESKQELEDKLGQKVDFLSYPFGRYNRYVQEETKRLGYRAGFTLCRHSSERGSDDFSLSRWGVYLLDSPLSLRIKINQDRLLWMKEMRDRIINCFSGWTIILKGNPDYQKDNNFSDRSHTEIRML